MRAQAHLPLHTAVLSYGRVGKLNLFLLLDSFKTELFPGGGVPTWTEMDPRRWRGTQFMPATSCGSPDRTDSAVKWAGSDVGHAELLLIWQDGGRGRGDRFV